MDNNQTPQNFKKLYIGNLPWSQTEEDLRALCEPFGELGEEGVKLITDNEGRSRGFAFAEFKNEEDAKKALEGLNEREVDGRKLFVKVARPKKERSDFNRGFGGNRNNRGDRRNNRSFGNDSNY